MHVRTRILLFTGVLTSALAAWAYVGARTLRETVGFDAATFFLATAVSALGVALVGSGVFALLSALWRRAGGALQERMAIAALAAATGVGVALGEVVLLSDEVAFFETVAASPHTAFSRARPWPAETAALVYRPGIGVHATD